MATIVDEFVDQRHLVEFTNPKLKSPDLGFGSILDVSRSMAMKVLFPNRLDAGQKTN